MIPGYKPPPALQNMDANFAALALHTFVRTETHVDNSTLSDAELPIHAREITAYGGGTVTYQRLEDTVDHTDLLPAGGTITGVFKFIKQTGTNATNLRILY